MVHVLAYATLASQIAGSCWLAHWLVRTGTRPWTWQRKVRVPRVEGEFALADDSYVGLV